MNLYFLRHADAEDKKPGQTDAQRKLTPRGREQSRNVADWLARRGITVEGIVSSPLTRARQTAEPVAAALAADLAEDERLGGGRLTISALAGILADAGRPESILLVGHEPDISGIIAQLTGEDVTIKKAAIALVTCDTIAAGAGRLKWVETPASKA